MKEMGSKILIQESSVISIPEKGNLALNTNIAQEKKNAYRRKSEVRSSVIINGDLLRQ
jgi:hypothetical protein